MKVLHIIATPRSSQSNTLRVSEAFLEALAARHDDLTVDVVDLFNYDLPAVTGGNLEVKYSLMVGQPIDRNHSDSWHQIELLIAHFLSADIYLISTPMWNFSIPYVLKYYIDCIVQPGFAFRYSDVGDVVPLVLGRKMLCVTSRGSNYSAYPMTSFDFQEPYLRAIFGFIGIAEIDFINAEPMDITPLLREYALSAATDKARALAARSEWVTVGSVH